MSGPDAHARPTWPVTLVLGVATAALVVAATYIMFSAFMIYDDEGYVLISLRNFAEHGGLYRDVYTQYGPFPFVFYYALQTSGIPLTHTIGRLITIGAWTGTAWYCAALAGYATRSLVTRLAVLAAVFLYLWIMSNEPTHPGGIIVLLIAMLAAFGYRWISTGRLVRWAILVGAVTATLVLTKINIGAFVAFSAVMWWLLHHQNDVIRRWAPGLATACAVLLPVALMRPLLGTPWVQTYVLVFGCSAVAVVLATTLAATGRVGWKTLGVGMVAGAIVATVVLSVVFLRGTQPHELLEGLVLGPLRQPTNFSLRYNWVPGIRMVAVVSVLGCALACVLRRRQVASVDVVIAWLRLIAALALAANIARFPSVSPDYLIFGFTLPCIWLYAWPLPGEHPTRASAQAWVAFLLLGQCLHVFPVPGSQIAWASVLAIPIAALGAFDAAKWLARRKEEPWFASAWIATAARLLMVGFVAVVGWKFAQLATRYRVGQNVGLPGAESIRVPDRSAALLQTLAYNAVAHADVLFSLPGMFSFNLWTGLPTPTLANVTHWFSLLDPARQQAIAQALAAHPRACIIIDRGHLDFLNKYGITPRGLLCDYIAKNFEPAFVIDRFEFCVHRGRHIEPFLLADLLTRAESGAEKSATEGMLLKFTTLLATSRPVASVELSAGTTLISLHDGNARIEIAPANARGERIGPARPQSWPFALKGPGIVFIYFDHERPATITPEGILVLRDMAGDEVALARVRR